MDQEVGISIEAHLINDQGAIEAKLRNALGAAKTDLISYELIKRSVDARGRKPKFQLRFRTALNQPLPPLPAWKMQLKPVHNAREVLVIGFGPAGMFAALKLIELGFRPIVIERGKKVRERRRDLAILNKQGIVNPESNYCFGEGGAGTFSDGKLYTRSHKRGNVRRILEIFCAHGADRNILIETHPHIGTNKLPGIVSSIRETIESFGGVVRFNTKVTDFVIKIGAIRGVQVNHNETISADAVILATGHSARDIFELLHKHSIPIEAKPFAAGVRIEHPQSIIDKIQYNCEIPRPEYLPAASYSLVRQVKDKGVFSFCMCPGGIICPSATAEEELVVNGWSPSKRNSPYANSGMVVEVGLQDFGDTGPLAGLDFQASLEKAAFLAGGGKQVAPAQRVTDFLNRKSSTTVPQSSYIPGTSPSNLHEVLPEFISNRLAEGIRFFGKKLRGFISEEAQVLAVESRTSSPVKIPRDHKSLEHPTIKGLFPCAEGAGYAGGIMSAAIDGERCADAIGRVFTA